MKTKSLLSACVAAAALGLVAQPAVATPPVPPHIDDIQYVWHGLGTDDLCHATLTVTLEPGTSKGRNVWLFMSWTADGVSSQEGWFATTTPGQTTYTQEMAYCMGDYAYEGIVISLRWRGSGRVIDTVPLDFPQPYICQ